MILDVQYAETFNITLKAIVTFIDEKWGETASDEFIKKAEKVIENIRVHPYIFKATGFDNEIRIAQINKLSLMYYQVSKAHITLLYIIDSRQDPYWL